MTYEISLQMKLVHFIFYKTAVTTDFLKCTDKTLMSENCKKTIFFFLMAAYADLKFNHSFRTSTYTTHLKSRLPDFLK